jgi:uncharacterized membrane protein
MSYGWQVVVVGGKLVPFALLALIYVAAMGVAGRLHYVLWLLLFGPMLAAVFAVVLCYLRTGRFDLNKLQDGFQVLVPAVLAGLIVIILGAIGWALLIVPGLIVMALYLFPLFLIVDRKMPFWEAMEESRKKVQQDMVGFVGLALAIVGANLLGVVCLGVGVLVSLPISWCAVAAAYRELFTEETAPAQGESASGEGPAMAGPTETRDGKGARHERSGGPIE